jgi:hypothetical protein
VMSKAMQQYLKQRLLRQSGPSLTQYDSGLNGPRSLPIR